MIDRRPRLIVRCADVADVIAAVNFGRQNNMLLAIRSGGHNAAGLGVCDDGLLIDLSLINYTRVDPSDHTVRVGGGCTWHVVDRATHALGLAVEEGEDRVKASYRENYDRLAAIKKKYDQTNLFRVNQNVKPA